jgi:hypothetical protein
MTASASASEVWDFATYVVPKIAMAIRISLVFMLLFFARKPINHSGQKIECIIRLNEWWGERQF